MGFRPHKSFISRPPPVRVNIKKDTTLPDDSNLPILTLYNARSLFPKITTLATDIDERETDICCVTEVWEKISNKKHQMKIEEMLEMKGLKYISTPRRNGRRGGGAAIIVNLEKFTLSKLNVKIPRVVETVWGLLKPKKIDSAPPIIVCCFYSPPNRKKNPGLIEHLTVTLQKLTRIYVNAGLIICGDRNHIEIPTFLALDPALDQIVTEPTYGNKTLDIICTNLASYYNPADILPPLSPDNPLLAAPSDHNGAGIIPLINVARSRTRNKIVKMIRPLPESLLSDYQSKLSSVNFSSLESMDSDDAIASFEEKSIGLFHAIFPEKKITIYDSDKRWFNEELRNLKRKRMREYVKNGKSAKYLELKAAFTTKSKEQIAKLKERLKAEVLEGKRGSSYPVLKKLAARPASDESNFFLPGHTGLTTSQSAERIADHFSKISLEYEPLSYNAVPLNIRNFLSTQAEPPSISVSAVKSHIIRAKKPLSTVPGDLPKKIIQRCVNELAVPIKMIFDVITRDATYPIRWKTEHQIPIPKTFPPKDEDDLRNIAKTPFFSKVYESFVAQWLLSYIKPYIDPNQCGLKGSSINHYLIKLLHFVHATLDQKTPHAVLTACFDLSKAFNRVDHILVIQDLFDMHTPSWLLKIIISYLSGRQMTLSYREAESSIRALPAGTPQGAHLGGLIFIIKFNGAFLRPPIPRPISYGTSEAEKVKYIDDGTVAVGINLKDLLTLDPVARQQPVTFHERSGHILPPGNNLLQFYVHDTEDFVQENKMILNKSKTTVMKFINSRKIDFPPEITFRDGTMLQTVTETRLLGVIITSDLKWGKNTTYIINKARKKLWLLRRMKSLDLSAFELFDVYIKEVRSLLEFAVPVWHSSITKKQRSEIESVQKLAFKLILGSSYSYSDACAFFGTTSLEKRRQELCFRFANKNVNDPENCLFSKYHPPRNLRDRGKIVNEFRCNKSSFHRSSIPYLSRLINSRT